jgi:DNA (cytosine-5)-methyltransferase 1
MNELALFAGAGGGILGGHLLGWRTVCAVEWEPYAAAVLIQRQNDGILPAFPVWDDVQTFDGRPWRGIVDVVSGGFPCQDLSSAGKRAGLDGARSGLWKEMARVVSEVRPRYVLVENSPMLVNNGLGRVLGDLSDLGFDARWTVMGAKEVGAQHNRDRVWIVANANSKGLQWTHNNQKKAEGIQQSAPQRLQNRIPVTRAMLSTSYFQRRSDAMASWMDRLKAIGNGQVPLVAATAWSLLK